MKRSALWCGIGLLGVLGLVSCKNNNLFGDLHREGSGDAESLVADGQAALGNSDFADANNYFSQALSKDPGNSAALYGQAAAQMGLSGLSLGQLISNLTQGNSSLGSPALRGAIQEASLGATSGGRSLLFGIDAAKLDESLKVVINNLETIHMGLSDGKIDRDNASLLINLGLARLLKGVTGPLRQGIVDITETGGSYVAEVTPGALPGSEPEGCGVVVNAVYNVAWGFRNLSDAALKLNLVSGSTLSDITNDVDALYENYKGEVIDSCSSVPSSRSAAGVPINPDDRLNS
jgi:hypothetical protein